MSVQCKNSRITLIICEKMLNILVFTIFIPSQSKYFQHFPIHSATSDNSSQLFATLHFIPICSTTFRYILNHSTTFLQFSSYLPHSTIFQNVPIASITLGNDFPVSTIFQNSSSHSPFSDTFHHFSQPFTLFAACFHNFPLLGATFHYIWKLVNYSL